MTKCLTIRIQVSVLRINGPLVIICSESFILTVHIKICISVYTLFIIYKWDSTGYTFHRHVILMICL